VLLGGAIFLFACKSSSSAGTGGGNTTAATSHGSTASMGTTASGTGTTNPTSTSSGPGCGNGAIDPGEECDGANLGVSTCASLGFGSGTLACSPQCKFDSSACVYPRWGYVSEDMGVYSNNKVGSAPTMFSAALASFADPSTTVMPTETNGACMRYVYPYPGKTLTYLDGGLIHITGGTLSPVTLTPTPSAVGYTYQDGLNGSEQLFQTGNTLHFDSAGNAQFPPFSGDVPAPAQLTITAPANFDTMTAPPATFGWTPAGGQSIGISVSTFSQALAETQAIACVADDSAGTFTIPASLMAHLHTSPTFMVAIVTRVNQKTVNVGTKAFEMVAETERERYYQP
jgi:hypothetical protein